MNFVPFYLVIDGTNLQVARYLMKTVSQLPSGKKPVGTTAYMGRVEHLMHCTSDVQRGNFNIPFKSH